MPHTSTTIYIDTSQTPHIGVDTSDIAYVLGNTSTDVGTLCIDTGIAKWAKYKPVRSTALDYFGSQGNANTGLWNNNATWWKGPQRYGTTFALCSMKLPYAQGTIGSIASGFIRDLADGDMGWDYYRPDGLTNGNPYRMMDFLSYNHASVSPLPTIPTYDMKGYEPSTGACTMTGVVPTITEFYNLTLADLAIPSDLLDTSPALNTFYFGLLFYDSAKNEAYWCTAINPLNNTTDNKHINVPFMFSTSLRGKFYVRPFLSRDQLTQNQNPSSGFYVAAAEEVGTMVIASSTVIGTANFDIITAKWLDMSQLNARIEVYNYKSTSVSASVLMEIVTSGGIVVNSRSYSATTIASAESEIIGGPWNEVPDPDYILRVTVTIDGTAITKTSTIEPID